MDDFFTVYFDSQISCMSLNIVGIMYDNETQTILIRLV